MRPAPPPPACARDPGPARQHAARSHARDGCRSRPVPSHSVLTLSDIGRRADLAERYADLGLGLGGTDASLVAIAERLGIDRIATFDRRHFSVVRPAHVEIFTLLP